MWERRLLTLCAVTAIIAGLVLIEHRVGAHYVATPTTGGVYREGIVTTSSRDVDTAVARLTKVGLVTLDATGMIQPGLASAWTVSDDNQTFTFTLDSRMTAQQALDSIKGQTTPGYWNEAEIKVTNDQTLEFHLSKPWAGYPTELAIPIFPFGPYTVTKTKTDADTETVYLAVRPEAVTKPYLSKMELHFYPDSHSLDRAVRKGGLEGAYIGEYEEIQIPPSWDSWHVPLVQDHVVFFNIRNEVLAKSELRQKLIKNERLDEKLTLRLVTPDIDFDKDLANDLITRWAESNVELTVESYPLLTLTKTVIPQHDYDLLLLGVDYGTDGDLYPYWHSSQIAAPGQNLAGYRNKEVDRLLDEARRERDAAARKTRYAEVLRIVTDGGLILNLGHPEVGYARDQKIRGDLVPSLFSITDRWRNIENWYTKEKYVAKK